MFAAVDGGAGLEAVPLGIIDDLNAGRAETAKARLGAKGAALPAQALLGAWQDQAGKLGPLQKIELLERTEQAGFVVFTHAARFPKGALKITTAVDPLLGKAEGFHFKPLEPDAEPAAYVRRDGFTATELTFGAISWELRGTLTVPKGAGPFPALVLVHGS